jgi:hypothetical protein
MSFVTLIIWVSLRLIYVVLDNRWLLVEEVVAVVEAEAATIHL